MSKESIHGIIRYAAYFLEFLILYTIQTTPHLMPEILGGVPIFLIPAAAIIAMYEPEIPSMFIGLLAGILLDFSGGKELGFYALVLSVICFIIASMSEKIIQTNFVTALIVCILATAAAIMLHFLFYYAAAGYSYSGYALVHHYLPRFVYTAVFIPVLYLINKLLAINLHA